MILAILQTRMSSRRLPGKAAMSILGKPMLVRQIERLRRSNLIDNLVVATSTEVDDDAIAAICVDDGVKCFRGSLADVLDRFYQVVTHLQPQIVVRLTGDCPLADWEVIDGAIRFFQEGGYDYASNTIERSWPDGLDVEVLTPRSLEEAWREGQELYHREHVTPFIHGHPERFRLGNYSSGEQLAAHRWTVDDLQDFRFVTAVYEALYPQKPDFLTDDILKLLAKHPELSKADAHFLQANQASRLFECESNE